MGGLGWFWGFGVRLPRTGPGGSGPFRAGPNQSRLVRTGLVQTGPARFGLFRTGPFRTGPIRTNPDRCGPVHAIPTLFFGPWIVQKRNLILLVGPTGQQTRTPPSFWPTQHRSLHANPYCILGTRWPQKCNTYCIWRVEAYNSLSPTALWRPGAPKTQPIQYVGASG